MEQIPKIVGQRLQAVSRAEVHPDANLLAAFTEKSLLPREQAQILEHLAVCAECREVVAYAQPEDVMQGNAVVASAPLPRSWFSGAVVRWAALAACVVVVGAVVVSRTKFTAYAPVATDSKPAIIAKTEPQLQSVPNAPTEKEEANYNASDRLKAPSNLPPKRDLDRLSELDKQRAANTRGAITVPNGSFRERRQAEESVNGLVVANNSPLSSPATVPMSRAAAAPLVAEKQEDAKSNKKEFSADKAMRAPAGTNEVAQAQAGPAPPPPPPPAAEKPATTLADSQMKRDESEGLKSAYATYKAKDGYIAGGAMGGLAGATIIPTWQLSSEGKLVKSLDHGQSWQPAPVGGNTVFRALCVTGVEIWVGGNQGNLFYSSDFGQHWEQVKPVAKGQILTTDITAIEFKDPKHGKVTTADHQTWTTNDGGHDWKLESR